MKKGDFILLSAAAVMLLAYFIPLSGGSNVNIYVDGLEILKFVNDGPKEEPKANKYSKYKKAK